MNRPRVIRLLLAAAVMAAAAWFLRGYTTDDTWIHLRYARNLIELGEFSFNPGEATYGATSPLWIFLLALLMKLGLAPAAAAWCGGLLAGILTVVMADAIITRLTMREYWKGVVLLLIVCEAWFLRWTFSGMETPLATAGLLVLIWPLVSGRDLGWGVSREALWVRYLAWGVGAGLTGLVRPELLVVAPLALPVLLWFEYYRAGAVDGRAGRLRARPWKPLAAAIGGWSLVVGPWLVYAASAFGRLTPGTAAAKSSADTPALPVILEGLLAGLVQLGTTQAALWLTTLALMTVVLLNNRREPAPLVIDPFGDTPDGKDLKAAGAGPWSVWGPISLVGIAVIWTGALLLGYAVKQVWLISRYVSPLIPVQILALSVIGEWLVTGTGVAWEDRRLPRRVLHVGVILYLLVNGWLMTALVVPHARTFPTGIDTCYMGMGAWLRDNTPEDAVVAALDIGALGWSSERTVLDLMGLVSPEILEMGREMGFAEMVESGAWLTAAGSGPPDFLVDRAVGEPRWAGRTVDGVRFELVDTCVLKGVGLRERQDWTVALYRLVSGASRVRSSAGG